MTNYINANELVIKIGALELYGTDERNRLVAWHPNQNSIPYVLITDVLNAVNNQPTADIVERKKGKWIRKTEWLWRGYKCSLCGCIIALKTNYCPDCGAKMEVNDGEIH